MFGKQMRQTGAVYKIEIAIIRDSKQFLHHIMNLALNTQIIFPNFLSSKLGNRRMNTEC